MPGNLTECYETLIVRPILFLKLLSVFYRYFVYSMCNTRAVPWKTGKVVLKIACKTDVIVWRVCEGGDLELPIEGVDTPATRIGTWETVRQDGGALATVHQVRAAKCCEIFV